MKLSGTLLNLFTFYSISFSQAPVIQWSKCYGGYDSDKAYDVLQTTDGGFVIVGFSRPVCSHEIFEVQRQQTSLSIHSYFV